MASLSSRQALFERSKPFVGAAGPVAVSDTSSARIGVGGARSSPWCHGSVLLGAPRCGQEARGGVAKFPFARVGLGEGAKRGEVPATCGVFFGALWWASAQGRTICSPTRCSARVGVGEGAVAWGSINFRRPGVPLGCYVSGIWLGLWVSASGVPCKAPICSARPLHDPADAHAQELSSRDVLLRSARSYGTHEKQGWCLCKL